MVRNKARGRYVMTSMRLGLFLAVAISAGGCGGGLRGDGTLAVLEISDELHSMTWAAFDSTYTDAHGSVTTHHAGGDMVDAFCAGAHLWDALGAQVRCRREVPGQHAATSVAVVVSGQWEYPGEAAWFNATDGKIHFATMQWSDDVGARAAAAHEIGHALGLNHEPAGNLMAPDIDSPELTDADKAQFVGLWGAR